MTAVHGVPYNCSTWCFLWLQYMVFPMTVVHDVPYDCSTWRSRWLEYMVFPMPMTAVHGVPYDCSTWRSLWLQYSPWQKSCRLGTNWPEVPLKYISNLFFYKKWLILIPTAFGIMFWCKTKLLKSILTFTARSSPLSQFLQRQKSCRLVIWCTQS